MPGPFMPQCKPTKEQTVNPQYLQDAKTFALSGERTTTPTPLKDNVMYGMWITTAVYKLAGLPTGSYDTITPFGELKPENQRIVAEHIALQGQRIVDAAGIADFVEQYNIPVTGVERTVQ